MEPRHSSKLALLHGPSAASSSSCPCTASFSVFTKRRAFSEFWPKQNEPGSFGLGTTAGIYPSHADADADAAAADAAVDVAACSGSIWIIRTPPPLDIYVSTRNAPVVEFKT
jgi:hypothetical protein